VAEVTVLGVTNQDSGGGLGNLDALASCVVAVAGLAPRDGNLDAVASGLVAVAGLTPSAFETTHR